MNDVANNIVSSTGFQMQCMTNYIENKGFEGCFSFLHVLPYLCSVINTRVEFSSG